jgi:hypothetical protein
VPECGRAYDGRSIVLYGYGRGRHENISTANRRRIVWVAAGSMFGMIWQLPSMLLQGQFKLALALLMLPVLLVSYLLVRRRKAEHPGTVRVRLDAHGCVQYDDLTGPSPLGELLHAHGWLFALLAAALLFAGWRLRWMDALPFWIWTPIVLLIAAVAFHHSLTYRRRMRQIGDGAVADLNAAIVEPTPWKNVVAFSMKDLESDMFWVQTSSHGISLRPNHHGIDAEVHCAKEQAVAIQQLVHGWRDAVRAAPVRAWSGGHT